MKMERKSQNKRINKSVPREWMKVQSIHSNEVWKEETLNEDESEAPLRKILSSSDSPINSGKKKKNANGFYAIIYYSIMFCILSSRKLMKCSTNAQVGMPTKK